MNILALSLALISFLVTIGAIVLYLSTIPRNKVPVRPIALIFFLVVGIVLALYSLFLAIPGPVVSVAVVAVLSVLSIVMASFIFWVFTQRKIPIGDIKVKVGDTLLPFKARTSDGVSFSSNEFAGKRVLLKFFRGGWCPYCSAELKEFDALLPDLTKHGVSVFALSKDTVEEADIQKNRDGLSFTLLSDPKLEVIKQYGVEHHKALGGVTTSSTLFGLPTAPPNSFSSMAIPTSLLIDENGIIRWIDQSEDYRIRASREVVLDAVKSAFAS